MNLRQIVYPLAYDTSVINIRDEIEVFNDEKRKVFYLLNMNEKSRIVSVDTLKFKYYSQIRLPDFSYYLSYQRIRKCPLGNHADNILPYHYGLPNDRMQKLIDAKKVILMSCFGPGENAAKYYCTKHNISI